MTRRRLDHHASWTAQFCAAQRAAETLQAPDHRLLNDPYVRHFVRAPLLRLAVLNRLTASIFIRIISSAFGIEFHTFILLRARYAEEAWATAIRDGIHQLVLLGAGLDTAFLRWSDTPVTIFEVDTPANQRSKRAVAEKLRPGRFHDQTVWVPCDFEQDELRDRLLTNGFDPTRPSLVVWNGVTLYLTHDAIAKVLGDLTELCAPGSRLVFDYIDADVITGQTSSAGARRSARGVARRGEPFRSGFTTSSEVDALCADYGFQCREHLRVQALLSRYAPDNKKVLANDWQTMTTAQRT